MKYIVVFFIFLILGASTYAQEIKEVKPFPETCYSVDKKVSKSKENARFLPLMLCFMQDYQFVVYNEDGKIIFETTDVNVGWMLKDVEPGHYKWMIKGETEGVKFSMLTRSSVEITE
ncbi:hypothetical protein [Crocinitomix algicola]|uniref:hypothetical protein n=1 Tax=Crocinitomix algicola TaxID=1740263 RepID=UPI000834C563|nr:hypothetical protein [Crocinitomix algicola]